MRNPSALPKPKEIMMAVPEEAALRQIEIEAMRGILDNLRRLNDGQAEMLRTVHQMDARLIRQEVQNEQIAELKKDVAVQKAEIAELRSKEDQRKGALSLFDWFGRNWVILIIIFFIAALMLRANGKLGL
jgi:hypothetical protein